ncbi:ribonuclease H-like domain-containing protein [Tanacetum coccineum]|uniref:Ribonuclease H-like domain-containing protein n=1 Tax=Tanacetum coccineum TaxID=301880 RepID=A0ABQ5B559_9ASTR
MGQVGSTPREREWHHHWSGEPFDFLMPLQSIDFAGFFEALDLTLLEDVVRPFASSLGVLVRLPEEAFEELHVTELLKLMQFLMGLDDSYMSIRSSILSRETLPDVKIAYAIISSEESHRMASGSVSGHTQRAQTSAFMSNNPNHARPNGGSEIICENCGYNGHTIERCFKIIGYPSDFGKKKGQNSKGKNVAYNSVGTTSGSNTGPDSCSTSGSTSGGFTDEQLATLLSLFKDKGPERNVQANMADWHCMLRHPGDPALDVLKGVLKIDKEDKNHFCEICQRAKQTRKPFPLSEHKTKSLGDIVHLDLWGPYKNGVVERKHRHLLNVARCLMFQWGIPLRFWTECVLTATYLINRLPSSVLNDSKVKYGIEKFVSYSKLSGDILCFVTHLNKNSEPRSFFEASQSPQWIDAMNLEMSALLENDTWELVELPFGRKALNSKWVWKLKFKSSGEIERYKARLVAMGCAQKEGVDYEETFSPVVKMVTVRCVINLAVNQSWPIYQLDINNAFLYGDLDETVYMKPPQGFYPGNDKLVCRLKKSIYGLKQSPRQWNAKLTSVLVENGFCQSKSDYSLYTKSVGDVFLVLLVYVDDIIVMVTMLRKLRSLGILVAKSSGMSLKAFSDADWAKCIVHKR